MKTKKYLKNWLTEVNTSLEILRKEANETKSSYRFNVIEDDIRSLDIIKNTLESVLN